MPITDFLERNARLHPDEVSLVEVNPANQPDKDVSWREYSLIEASRGEKYRRELTWKEFDVEANRFANLLLTRGVKKGDKVAILLMNCINWLPIYFGILKAGAIAVPMNFRFSAEEIAYCSDLADVSVLIFGPEFIDRLEHILPQLTIRHYFYVGSDTPSFADPYEKMIAYCSSVAPAVEIDDEDDVAIFFSSGTTGFPKAILHRHRALVASCQVEQKQHSQSREDVFLCIPTL